MKIWTIPLKQLQIIHLVSMFDWTGTRKLNLISEVRKFGIMLDSDLIEKSINLPNAFGTIKLLYSRNIDVVTWRNHKGVDYLAIAIISPLTEYIASRQYFRTHSMFYVSRFYAILQDPPDLLLSDFLSSWFSNLPLFNLLKCAGIRLYASWRALFRSALCNQYLYSFIAFSTRVF